MAKSAALPDKEKQEANTSEIVFAYTDEEAVADGLLIPLHANIRDTGHRITRNAYTALAEHYRRKGYTDYSDADFNRFFLSELLPLIPYARRSWERGGILKSDYRFRVGNWRHSKVLWYVPNERQGITVMQPADY